MSVSLKLISLNIEKSKHLDRVLPFLVREMPDVFCAQELYESAISRVVAALSGVEYTYIPMTMRPKENPPEMQGIAIFSRVPVTKRDVLYYRGTPDVVPESAQEDPSTYNNSNRMVVVCDVAKGGTAFRIATNHFAWTSGGQPDGMQRKEICLLLDILDRLGEFVLAGDFNAPRGGEIFGMLAAKYRDNVPVRYKTSLDASLHRAGKTSPEQLATKMVDGIFSTSAYTVSDVELVSGVSDHCAIVANVSKPS